MAKAKFKTRKPKPLTFADLGIGERFTLAGTDGCPHPFLTGVWQKITPAKAISQGVDSTFPRNFKVIRGE